MPSQLSQTSPQSGVFAELSVPVSDLDRTLRFYKRTMGLSVTHEGEGFTVLEDSRTGQPVSCKECDLRDHPTMSIADPDGHELLLWGERS